MSDIRGISAAEAAIMEQELRTGFKFLRGIEVAKQREARRQHDGMEFKWRHNRHTPDAKKRWMSPINAWDNATALRLIQKYGIEEFNSREFQRAAQRLEPDVKINRI